MSISRSLATIGAALALAAPAGLAHADSVAPQTYATGLFFYANQSVGRQFLVDPQTEVCLPIDGQPDAGPVMNRTDAVAIVFMLPDCLGPGYLVPPGQSADVPFPMFESVEFEHWS